EYRLAPKEMDMAEQLIDSMTSDWTPDSYHDEFRERLLAIIQKRIKSAGATTRLEESDHHEEAATNVVDFMSLLQQSLDTKKRTAAGAAARKSPTRAGGSGKRPGRGTKTAPPRKRAS